jgi:hypothetical protein
LSTREHRAGAAFAEATADCIDRIDHRERNGRRERRLREHRDNVNAGLVLHKYRGWYRTDRLDPYAVSATRSLNAGQSDLIVVTYAGGYVTPGQNALDAVTYPTVDLPEDVQEAAIFTACAFLRLKGTDPNVKSEAIGDWSISFFDAKTADGNAVPAYARALLAPYKLGWAL